MECQQAPWPSDDEYLVEFGRKLTRLRIPLYGSLELTYRCNLKCVHCFQGPRETCGAALEPEMTTEQVLSVVDEMAEAGCLFLVISGGEPLLRPDFGQVYRHAKNCGMFVTVLTNGTLVTEQTLELFGDLPPEAVDVTVYGATSATYEGITGIPGSFERCMSGIRRMLDQGVRVKLKTMLMTLNCHEVSAMEDMARSLGVPFRLDAGLFPCINGDRAPLAYRVAPEDVIRIELSDPERLRQWREYYEPRKNLAISERLYTCGAGVTGFHVNPFGQLQPCLMARRYRYDLLAGNFAEGWIDIRTRIRERKAKASYLCNRCDKRVLCNFCPAFSEMENGSEEVRSEYLCAIGHLRYNAINDHVGVQ